MVRSIHVIASHDDDWELETLCVRVHVHFGRRLAGGVWVGGCEHTVLEKIWIIEINLSHDFIRRHVDESFDLGLDSALEHGVCTFDVGLGELERVSEAQIDMRLRSEMEDGINLVLLQRSENIVAVGDVAKGKVEVFAV